jgi:RNA polymerase sigma-70 factor (ECF subfamily)
VACINVAKWNAGEQTAHADDLCRYEGTGVTSACALPLSLRTGYEDPHRERRERIRAARRNRVVSELDGEAEALARLRDGDVAGLEPLVRLHQTRALRIAFGITGTREEAEDVVMDTFVAVAARIHQLDMARPFTPWFQRMVINRSISAMRSSRRHAYIWNLIGRTQLHTVDPSDVAESHDLRDRLTRAFSMLTTEERAVATLRLALEMSEKDAAETLGWRVGTVKSRLARARRKLRRRLSDPVAYATGVPDYKEN